LEASDARGYSEALSVIATGRNVLSARERGALLAFADSVAEKAGFTSGADLFSGLLTIVGQSRDVPHPRPAPPWKRGAAGAGVGPGGAIFVSVATSALSVAAEPSPDTV
jgi:hypothetical protein